MKRYIKSSKRFVSDPMERLKSKLGISWGSRTSLRPISEGKWNFVLSPESSRYATSVDEWISTIKKIGGKYITKRYGDIYFYYDMSELKSEYERDKQQAEDDYSAELNAMDIDQYKPTDAIIKKLIGYRDKGSNVNVKAIKDLNKLFTYYYAASIIGWRGLKGAIFDTLRFKGYDDLLSAIDRRVKNDEKYVDTRTAHEIENNIPSSNGLLTFEDKHCWLPRPLLMYFIENQIPVHFGKRTRDREAASWDRNGRDWSEIEHLTIYPDSDNPLNYDVVVTTDEGGGSSRYTGLPKDGRRGETDEYTSAKKLLDAIGEYIQINTEEI